MTQKERPHKSLTHEEMFFHVQEPMGNWWYKGATVFFRKEADGYWYASAAYCSAKDQFNRRVGRSQARRRYFAEGYKSFPMFSDGAGKPNYDNALAVAYTLMPIRT